MTGHTKLGVVLGTKYDIRTVAPSAILSLLLFFYIPFITSFFQVDVYLLIDRATYHTILQVEHILWREVGTITIDILLVTWFFVTANRRIEIIGSSFLASFVLAILALDYSFLSESLAIISVPLVLAIIFLVGFLKHDYILVTRNRLIFNYLAVIGIVVAVASIYLTLSRDTSTSPSNVTDPLILFYLLFSYFSPIAIFLCIFSVFISTAIRPILKKLGVIKYLLIEINYRSWRSSNSLSKYLIIIIIFSMFMVSIPYFNPARQEHGNISVDVIHYERWISGLQNTSNIDEFLNKLLLEISGGDRPLSLLMLLPIANLYPEDIRGSLELVTPLILAPAFVIVMYFLTRELTDSEYIAILCSFLTAISFQLLVGTYAGYYANWIGLIVMYLSLFFLLKYLRSPGDSSAFFLYSVLALALLFIHSYTWTILIFFTLIFVLASCLFRLITHRTFIMICLILASLVGFDLLKTHLGVGTGAIGRDLFTIERTGTGYDQVEDRWSNLVRTAQVYVGGIYGNIFLLTIAFLGSVLLYYNTRNYRISSCFVLTFFSLGILPLFFGDREIMARIVYDIPFQIPAAISLFWLKRYGIVGTVFSIAISVFIVAASIRLAANI